MDDTEIAVWDRFVRFFHWALVALVSFSLLTAGVIDRLHAYSGYTIVTLVLLRIAWGFGGGEHARFRNFLRPPAEALRYLRGLRGGTAQRHLGHNPAGGWMTVLLLACLLATASLGMVVYGLKGHGPLGGLIAPDSVLFALSDGPRDGSEAAYRDAAEAWHAVHENMAWLLFTLICLHIGGVIASSRAHGENLVRAMWTGRKRRSGRDE